MGLACVSSTQSSQNPLGFRIFHQIKSRSSFIEPLHSRHSKLHLVGYRNMTRSFIGWTSKPLADYCVTAPKKLANRQHVPPRLYIYPLCQLCCHSRTGTPPSKFARRIATKARTSQAFERLSCLIRYLGIYENPDWPKESSRHHRKKSDFPICSSTIAFSSRQPVHLLQA
jgi:hypothetical protein